MLTVFCFFVFEKQGLMFTTDGRPVGEKVAGGIATLYSMPYWSTVRPVMASAPLPPRLTLALPGHHNPWGPFRGIAGGCVVSWAAGGSPYILVGHGEVSFFGGRHSWLLSWTDFILLCGVLDPGKGRLTPWGVRRGGFVTALHPSVLLAGAPTSELPVALLSSCNKKQCPPHWLGSQPILTALPGLLLLVPEPLQRLPPPSLAPEPPHTP